MATVEIPLDSSLVAQKFRVDLDGITFTFDFDFNERSQRWRMNISDDVESPLLTGVPVLPDVDLLRYHQHNPNIPQGNFAAFNLDSPGVPPVNGELGSEVILIYEEVI